MKDKPLDLMGQAPSAYAEMMAAEVRKHAKPTKILPLDMDPEERRKAILAMQSPSTRRALERPESEDAAWLSRPLPVEQAQIAKTKEDMAKFERKITPEEFTTYTAMREHPKNSLGQSELSGASDTRRLAAVEAYLFTPPAEITPQERDRISQIAPYTPPPPLPPEEPKLSWWRKCLGMGPKKVQAASPEQWGWLQGYGFRVFGNKKDDRA